MFKKPENVLKSNMLAYLFIMAIEMFILYGLVTPEFVTDQELLTALVFIIPLIYGGGRVLLIAIIFINFLVLIRSQMLNIYTGLKKYKKQILYFYFFPLLMPLILIVKNSGAMSSLAFLASWYFLFVYVVLSFNVLLLIRGMLYMNGNDMLGRTGWLTLFTIGLVSSDISPLLKVILTSVIAFLLFVFSLFLLNNFLHLYLKDTKRLPAGSIWQINVHFQQKNFFRDILTFHNILKREEIDTRCDFFQKGIVLLSSTYINQSIENFIQVCRENYYVIIDTELYVQFVLGNEEKYSNVIMVAIKTDEFIEGREFVPYEFEEIVSDFYRSGLNLERIFQRLSKKRKKNEIKS